MTDTKPDASPSKLDMYESYLAQDPTNLTLLGDTAEAALASGDAHRTMELLDRYRDFAPLGDRELSLAGLAAMRLKDFQKSIDLHTLLVSNGASNSSIKFNLAWSQAMMKQFDTALSHLDEETISALPQAAMLRLQLVHQAGDFDQAGKLADQYLQLHPDDEGLSAAISVLAMDIDKPQLAKACAERAPDHPDALTTLGVLSLGEEDTQEALTYFERAGNLRKDNPRTLIGRGLARMSQGHQTQAIGDLDRGAELFEDHIGSWIAAGWAHLLAEDLDLAQNRFEKAFNIDNNFAESHGSLAVVHVLRGKREEAQRMTKTALRLDRACFSAALAQTLLFSSSGQEDKAKAVFEAAVNAPLDESGRTIAQSLVKLGLH